MPHQIKSTITAKIGFASHQNSVPVVRELEVVSDGELTLENLLLELSSDLLGGAQPKDRGDLV